jgi:hypothetical protein
MTPQERTILALLRGLETICRNAAGQPDPATAIASGIEVYRDQLRQAFEEPTQ